MDDLKEALGYNYRWSEFQFRDKHEWVDKCFELEAPSGRKNPACYISRDGDGKGGDEEKLLLRQPSDGGISKAGSHNTDLFCGEPSQCKKKWLRLYNLEDKKFVTDIKVARRFYDLMFLSSSHEICRYHSDCQDMKCNDSEEDKSWSRANAKAYCAGGFTSKAETYRNDCGCYVEVDDFDDDKYMHARLCSRWTTGSNMGVEYIFG